jgi:hypothetical protein
MEGTWVVGSHEFLMFSHGFVFGVVIPSDLVELSSLVACHSVLLVENLDGCVLYVKSGSNGMVSSVTTSVGGFRHLLSWEA